MQTIDAPTAADETSDDLAQARAALRSAHRAAETAWDRRPAVVSTGRRLADTVSRNHLAQLVHDALGSGH